MPVPTKNFNFTAHTKAKAAEVNSDLDELYALLDHGLDGANMIAGTPGQLWVVNGSGVPQLRSVTGPVRIDASGLTSIPNGSITNAMLAGYPFGGGGIAPNAVGSTEIGTLPAFELTKSGSQSIPQNVNTPITWDVETADPNNGHSGSSADYVVPVAGIWILSLYVAWSSTISESCDAAIRSGGTFIGSSNAKNATSFTTDHSVVAIRKLAAGATLDAIAQQTTTGARTIDSTCCFSGVWCGDG